MIGHLIDKTEQQKQLEAWDRFLELALTEETKRLIVQVGIVHVAKECRVVPSPTCSEKRYNLYPAYITHPRGRKFDLVTGEEIKCSSIY